MFNLEEYGNSVKGALVTGTMIVVMITIIDQSEIDLFFKILLQFIPVILYVGAIITDALANLDSNKSLGLWIAVSFTVFLTSNDALPIILTILTMIMIQLIRRQMPPIKKAVCDISLPQQTSTDRMQNRGPGLKNLTR